MSHYSTSPSRCRVDFFKPSGKWYEAESIQFPTNSALYDGQIPSAFGWALYHGLRESSVENPTSRIRMLGMITVCLDPYHAHAYPQMMKVEDAIRYWAERAGEEGRGPLAELDAQLTAVAEVKGALNRSST